MNFCDEKTYSRMISVREKCRHGRGCHGHHCVMSSFKLMLDDSAAGGAMMMTSAGRLGSSEEEEEQRRTSNVS